MAKCPFYLDYVYSIVADSPGMSEFFVSYPLDKQLSMSIACCFANIHRILAKVEQRFFNIQMPFGVHTVSDREL